MAVGGLEQVNYSVDGLPSGGYAQGKGIDITFQCGPMSGPTGHNGCFVEDLIAVAVERLEYYQGSKFNCKENAAAIVGLKSAMTALVSRTAKRTERGVEGTHEV
ncbi:hypothetical protein NVP1244A_161 [Vibrio phage 1.244.A._10N.261.54.C3]|nr:hypothetical protein NVP1244A_161 [Vibrio phage 1.244.A._10N.261.54.C3]AUR98789.1 hypothetical protein NVP1255O_161 [Vibrio phage 1.255.O._10N.286.45.F1]